MKADKTFMNMPALDLSLDVRELIEKHFTGMYSGEIGVSTIAGWANSCQCSIGLIGYFGVCTSSFVQEVCKPV